MSITANVNQIRNALSKTGVDVTRAGVTKPRINVLMRALAFLALLALPVPALAELSLTIPGEEPSKRTSVHYACEGLEAFKVEYVNAGDNSLAVIPLKGRVLVFANVLAASGARYAAGPYVWWTKGRSADLYDLRHGNDAAPIASCAEAGS